jgi:cardiolipin synthase
MTTDRRRASRASTIKAAARAATTATPRSKAGRVAGYLRGTSRPRPKSRPATFRWRQAVSRRRVRRALRPRSEKGRASLWVRLRRLFWSWWLWTALGIWLASRGRWEWASANAVMAVLCHLLQPRSEPPRLGLDHEFAVESTEFLATMSGATGVPYVPGNSLEVLNNGNAFYPRMLADIAAAKVSICVEAYIYWAGEVGAQFADALAERARAGVRVMVLLDAVGSSDIGDETLETLEGGGCQVVWYNPINWRTLGRYNNRTHRKSLIVDGVIAYTGGAGIADHWRGDARGPDEWRDLQIRFEGPAVRYLQSGFAHNWQQTTGELVSGEGYYPEIAAKGPYALQVVLSSPEVGGSSVQVMYFLAIVCARKSIFIANPYFVPNQVATETFIEARRRGVDIRIMVTGIRSDNWLARKNSTRHYGPLLRAGVRIFEYHRSMMHHKVMVVDSLWSTIGTTNFDSRSFAHNEESNVCVQDAALARELEQTFEHDTAICEEITLAAWERRGPIEKTMEIVASLLEDQV